MYNADIAQLVERVIGNDEVPGRIRVSAPENPCGWRFPGSLVDRETVFYSGQHISPPPVALDLRCIHILHVYAFLFRCYRFAFSSYTPEINRPVLRRPLQQICFA